jgi:hypothetical protein
MKHRSFVRLSEHCKHHYPVSFASRARKVGEVIGFGPRQRDGSQDVYVDWPWGIALHTPGEVVQA